MKQCRVPQVEEITVSRNELLIREAAAAVIAFNFLLLLTLLFHSTPESAAGSMGRNGTVHAPWVFAAIQLLLHYFSPVIAGLIIPLFTIFWVLFYPFFDDKKQFSHAARLILGAMIFFVIILTFAGSFFF